MTNQKAACRSIRLVLVGVLLAHAVLLSFAAFGDSPTWDEVGHYPAGISHWRYGDFRLYSVNPPLVRLVATAPVAFVAPEPTWLSFNESSPSRLEFTVGYRFITEIGETSFHYFSFARCACIPFSLLGAYVCYRWARILYGQSAGLPALLLWCFCPNVLTYGHMITPDVGAAALGVAAGYVFWQWLQASSWRRALIAGIVLGLCELTKTTWIVLFGLWPALYAVYHWRNWHDWKQLAVILLVAVWVLNLGYGFEGSCQPLQDYRFLSRSLGGPLLEGNSPHQGRNPFADAWIRNVPIPLPKNYVLGIDYVKWEFEQKMQSYLRGEWRHGGWYHYYLYACLIKVPLGTWLLGVLAVGMTILEWRQRRSANFELRSTKEGWDRSVANELVAEHHGQGKSVTWRDELVLLSPAVVVFVLVSSQTGFNHHLRYVLPAFPFAFIWISKVGRVFERQERETLTPALSRKERGIPWRIWLMRGAVAGALGWSVVSSLSVYPHNLSYFNELVGGPRGGHWHLANSNIDWGQDLLYLKDWYEEHPEARPLHLAYDLPLLDPKIAGINYEKVPPGPVMNRHGTPQTHNWPWGDVPADPNLTVPDSSLDPKELGPFPGWYCLSVNQIHWLKADYEYFLEFEPVDWIGYSMMVFHITLDQANQVRRKLGLPQLQMAEDREQRAEDREQRAEDRKAE